MYANPAYPSPDQPPGLTPEQARSRLVVPGIVLAVLSGLLIVVFLLDLLLFASGYPLSFPGMGGGAEMPVISPPFLIGVCIFGALANAFNLFAAIQMVRVRTWGLAFAGCIVAAIPLTTSACCVLTLPFSIWAMVVLLKPEIRDAFRRA